MKVWLKIQSFNRSYYKQTIICRPQDTLKFIYHLCHPLESLQSSKPSSVSQYNSINNIQRLELSNINNRSNNKKEKQFSSLKSNSQQINSHSIEVSDEDGNILRVNMQKLYVDGNLSGVLYGNKSDRKNKLPGVQLIENGLGELKYKIIQQSYKIPIHQYINAPNIISAIIYSSKQKQNKQTNKQNKLQKLQKLTQKIKQKKSKILSLNNNKFYLQLINQNIQSKIINYSTINNSLTQFKQLYSYFQNKIDQLIIDQQLQNVALFIISSTFLYSKNNQIIYSNQQSNIPSINQQIPINNQKYLYALFNFLQINKHKFWPYPELSLMTLLTLYDIFFQHSQFKIIFFFDPHSQFIHKIQSIPFMRLSQSALGRDYQSMMFPSSKQSSSGKFKFKGQIFRILMNSKQETKIYYKIPNLISQFQSSSTQPKLTLQDLIEVMSSFGFKMSEIGSILRNFSLVLNLGLIQIVQQQIIKGHSDVKIKQNQALKNIASLYSSQAQLISSIILGNSNNKNKQSYGSLQNIDVTIIKKQILMRILWQESINKYNNEINIKIQNIECDFSLCKRFEIFIHHNAKINEQKFKEQIFIQDNSIQHYEYELVGRQIINKQFQIQQTKKQKQKNNFNNKNDYQNNYQNNGDNNINTQQKLRNYIYSLYRQSMNREYTSYNSVIIDMKRVYECIYRQMRQLQQLRILIRQIFHVNKIQQSQNRYYNQFFKSSLNNNTLNNNKNNRNNNNQINFNNNLNNNLNNLNNNQNNNKLNNNISNNNLINNNLINNNISNSQNNLNQNNNFYKSFNKITQNNYIICTDYHHFIHQEKLGVNTLNFFIQLLKQTISDIQQQSLLSHYQSQKQPSQQLQSQPQQHINTYNQSHRQNYHHNNLKPSIPLITITPSKYSTKLPSSPQKHPSSPYKSPSPKNISLNKNQSINQSPSKQNKKNLTIIDPESIQPNHSIMKSPKRSHFQIQLSSFINKYLYGQELKKIHRFFNTLNKNSIKNKGNFNYEHVCEIIEKNIIGLNQLKISGENSKKSLSLSNLTSFQIKKAKQVITLINVQYDDIKQNYFIQASQNLFNKVQMQKDFQKLAVAKIVKLCRTFKWKKNSQTYFFRKHFLNQIKKLCGYRIFSKMFIEKIKPKYFDKLKAPFKKMNLKYFMEKFDIATKKVINAEKKYKMAKAIQRIYAIQSRKQSAQIMKNILIKAFKHINEDIFRTFFTGPYSLIVTTPNGNKKNMDDLSIDVSNVNNTAIIHSGNISTSNTKNLISQTNQRKGGFNKPIPFEQKPQSKQTINNQKVQLNKQVNQKQMNSDKYNTSDTSNQNSNKPGQIKNQNGPIKNQPQFEKENQPNKSQKLSEIKQEKSDKSQQKSQKNQVVSVLNSALSGSMVSLKSQTSQRITKQQLFQLKDAPFFSFQTWAKDIGAKFPDKQNKACAVLFRKYEAQKMNPTQQPLKQVEQDRAVKQKIINASFVNYLNENLNKNAQDPIESIFFTQKKGLQKALLKHYDQKKHNQLFKQMFNNILKISLHKNTSKKLYELLNLIIKPIKEAYNRQKNAQQTVFDDEPLMNASYDLDYNVLRDEMFLQFAKQIMGNQDKDSLISIVFAMDIISKNYYPSPKLFYPYLNHLKTNQLSKPGLFEKVYQNLLRFSQSIEGYKGAKVNIYKNDTIPMNQVDYNTYLEIRSSLFFNEECQLKDCTVKIQLFNRQRFQFKVANESLRSLKKRFLNELGFMPQQKNFGLYEERGMSNYLVVDQKQKAIDFLSKCYADGNINRTILQLRVKFYYPIRFKDINSLRMFYMNMIGQQARMPFKKDDYEHIVALSISFDEFEQDRISNYILITKKEKLLDSDLMSIKQKLQQMAKSQSSNKICEFEYFKAMKQFNFLLAKVYKVTKQKKYCFEQVDKIIIKPKQIRLYSGQNLKSSISLYRIKSFYFDNNQIHIDLIYSDRDLGDAYDKKFHGSIKNLVITDVYKIKELYEDIVYYTELLNFGQKS